MRRLSYVLGLLKLASEVVVAIMPSRVPLAEVSLFSRVARSDSAHGNVHLLGSNPAAACLEPCTVSSTIPLHAPDHSGASVACDGLRAVAFDATQPCFGPFSCVVSAIQPCT